MTKHKDIDPNVAGGCIAPILLVLFAATAVTSLTKGEIQVAIIFLALSAAMAACIVGWIMGEGQ